MKKLFFSALAVFAFVGSSFASTGDLNYQSECLFELEAGKKPCNIYLQAKNRDGKIVSLHLEAGEQTLTDCGHAMSQWIYELKEDGYVFDEKDAQLHWGR